MDRLGLRFSRIYQQELWLCLGRQRKQVIELMGKKTGSVVFASGQWCRTEEEVCEWFLRASCRGKRGEEASLLSHFNNSNQANLGEGFTQGFQVFDRSCLRAFGRISGISSTGTRFELDLVQCPVVNSCLNVIQDFNGRVHGLKVEPVDTTGAGDAFVAGLLSQLATDVSLLKITGNYE
ncbi:hypothetical protein M5K25_004147 [Dendrobium thyrsiflorum]|uniref:Carbohydrate kinase PfkB domain-containing protein n=1 Tax=Dendrobium thyrsiflorum TaxID=117978 RepID=A0ABD0VTD0_DENTH